jgi:predicted amidophosphoribosyltransferase
MTEYCESCGEELDQNEEEEGICKRCKKEQYENEEYEKDEDYIDPDIT